VLQEPHKCGKKLQRHTRFLPAWQRYVRLVKCCCEEALTCTCVNISQWQDLEYEWQVILKTYETALVKTASHGLGMKIKMRQGTREGGGGGGGLLNLYNPI
jgi:hypothetical protein